MRVWDRHAGPAGADESRHTVQGRQREVNERLHEEVSCNRPPSPPPQTQEGMARAELLAEDRGGSSSRRLPALGRPRQHRVGPGSSEVGQAALKRAKQRWVRSGSRL